MTAKERLLKMTCYEEFDAHRDEIKGLDMADPEVRAHIKKIFPSVPLDPGDYFIRREPDGTFTHMLTGKKVQRKP